MKDRPKGQKNLIKLSNISFAYRDKLVLEDVNLEIGQGDFIALLGANGAAKSTLLKLMVGILKPQNGRVEILNQDLKKFKNWSSLAYLSQEAAQINYFFPATVEEIVESGLYKGFGKYFTRKERSQAVEGVLRELGLDYLAKNLIGDLSGGQRQKVFLARALVNGPRILFLDEPTSGIDSQAQEEFYEILVNLNKMDKTTIVMVTHDLANILDLASTVVCLRKGRVHIYKDLNELNVNHISQILGYKRRKNERDHRGEN